MWGSGDRAWRFIESVFLRSPDKGFWACLGELFPDSQRLGFRYAIQCWNSVAFRTAPLSSSRIVPKVTIARVILFIPLERPHVNYAGYLRLPQPTQVPGLMRCCIGPAFEQRNKGTPLAIRPKIMARYEDAAVSLDDCCSLVLP